MNCSLLFCSYERSPKSCTKNTAGLITCPKTLKKTISGYPFSQARNFLHRFQTYPKFVINFHPVKEDTRKDLNLWELTRKTLEQIKTQFGDSVPFVATNHDDHTLLRHIHGFFIVQGKLPKEEFAKIKGLWKVASKEVRRQRRRLDGMHASQGYKKLLPLIENYKRKHQQGRGRRGRTIRMQPACIYCGYGGRSGMPAYLLTCPACKQWLTRSRQEYQHLGRRLHR